jgi:bifunctional UDP-N-acetylglucosamine pyrophosphorylase/glucosamine-1-phosphate N-acetyltransferase
MKSEAPKVLHDICGRSMLSYVIEACRGAGVGRLVIVVGHRKDDVIAAFSGRDDSLRNDSFCSDSFCNDSFCDEIVWVEQKEQKGTGHAAQMCKEALADCEGQILCIAGDMPLIRQDTLEQLLAENARTHDAVTLATSILDDPTSYGRIIRDDANALAAIIEDKDCSDAQRKVCEVNVSYYCFDGKRMFDLLDNLSNDNAKGEYYITDTVADSLKNGWGASAVAAVPPEDAMGINSRADLAVVARLMQGRIQNHWMDQGVSIVDPTTTWIESDAMIGTETAIYPFSFVGRGAQIGRACRIGPHAMIPAGEVIESGAIVGGGNTVSGGNTVYGSSNAEAQA